MKSKISKSNKAIIVSFFELRKKKDAEKITVTELCQLANINKSTFYVYYRDILDLSEKLESYFVQSILKDLDATSNIFTNAENFTKNLFKAYQKKEKELHILFSGSRQPFLPHKFSEEIKQYLFHLYPEFKDNDVINIQLNFAIYGAFYSYISQPYDTDLLIQTISTLVSQSVKTEEN